MDRMAKIYVLLILAISSIQGIYAQDYSVKFEVKTNLTTDTFPSIYTNKNWDGAATIDLISTSNMGLTLESGLELGWTIFMQPNGAWGWNIGDGKNRLDYLPSTLQRMNDGKWHDIAIAFYLDKKTAWLYFDGRHVAIYSLSELNLSEQVIINTMIKKDGKNIAIKKIQEGKFELNPSSQANSFKDEDRKAIIYDQEKPDKLTVMAWNIWHGARHNGNEKGIEQAIAAIKSSGADLVCMQETYGSGPRISDALGTLFYYRSSNLSVHSKFPIVDTYDAYQPFRFGGVRVKMGNQLLDVFSLWIHYLPSVSKMYPTEPVSKILEEENKTRGKEIKEILTSLKEISILGMEVPLIIGGDFNSSSHLDWGADTKMVHHGYEIEWPVSKSMAKNGFMDSFREMAPVPLHSRGYTWSPRFSESLQDRIDYIYYKGRLECVNSYVKGYSDSEWPSDHAAVVSEFRFE